MSFEAWVDYTLWLGIVLSALLLTPVHVALLFVLSRMSYGFTDESLWALIVYSPMVLYWIIHEGNASACSKSDLDINFSYDLEKTKAYKSLKARGYDNDGLNDYLQISNSQRRYKFRVLKEKDLQEIPSIYATGDRRWNL